MTASRMRVLLAAAAPRLGQADVPIIVIGLDDDPGYERRADRVDRQGACGRAAARRARSRATPRLVAIPVA